MDNLGVAMNDTTLEAYRLDKGIGKAVSAMTTAEKVGLAMDMFMENTAYAAGNYAKENETAAGSLQTLKAAWSNFLGGVDGVDFTTVSDSAFRYLRIAAKTMGAEGLEPFLQGAQDTVNSAVKILSLEGITGREKYSKILRLLSEKAKGIAAKVKETLPKGIEEASSIATETLSTINVDLPAYLDAGKAIFDSVRGGLKKAAEEFSKTAAIVSPDVIAGWFTAKTDFLSIGLDIIGGIAQGINDDLSKGENSKIAGSIKDGLQNVINSTAKTLPALTDAGLSLISAIIDGVNKSDLTGLSTAIEESVTKIVEWAAEPENIKALISAGLKIGEALLSGILKGVGRLPVLLLSKITPDGEELLAEYDKKQAEVESFMEEYNNVFQNKSVKEIVNTSPNTYKNGLKLLTQALLSGGDSSGNTEEKNGAFSAAADNMEKLNLMLASGEITLEEYKAKVEALKTAWDGVPEKKTTTYTVDTEYDGGGKKLEILPIFPHASGLHYVPYDNYPARLHRGEMVLTRKDAEDYRAENGGGINTKDLARLLANAMKSSPMNFYMGKKQVAFAISDAVGRRIEKRDHARVSAMGG